MHLVSATRGTHNQPRSPHLASLALCFLPSVARAAYPADTPASIRLDGLVDQGVNPTPVMGQLTARRMHVVRKLKAIVLYQLTVTWTSVPTATSYYVSINASVNTLVPIPSTGAPQYSFTGLTNNTVYTVSVVAINCAGSSSPATIHVTGRTASQLATCSSKAKPVVLTELYGRLNLHLVRANAIAILARSLGQSDVG
eukprot:Em0025g27a